MLNVSEARGQITSSTTCASRSPKLNGNVKAILLSLSFGFVLLIPCAIFIGYFDIRSRFFPLLQQPLQSPTSTCRAQPLRVYTYNLPRRFHIGMLNCHSTDDSPVTAQNLPPWPRNSGPRKQHSMEYWIMASLLYDGGGEDMEAARVSDPESADLFFVPFFSSLSFNTYGHNMTDPEPEVDHQLQIDLLEFLGKSKFWQRSGGRDHVITMTQLNAFRLLWEREGIVRAKLAKVLAGYDDVHYEHSVASTENIKLSTQGMRLSKFCLHPAGDTPSSCRLFDAIVSHCVPVIVSDQIELPYEDEIDYTQFSLFFSVEEALRPNYIVKQLREFKKERWIEMWRKLKNVSHHFEFQFPPRKGDAVDMLWRQVRQKVPAVRLATHRSRRLKIPDWWSWRR